MATIITHPASAVFGLHGIDCKTLSSKGWQHDDSFTSVLTLANIISWIPVIGAIIGAIRVYVGVQVLQDKDVDDDGRAIGNAFIGRGVTEILCLGPLLMVVDVIMAIARKCL